jgi:hypothetical protein
MRFPQSLFQNSLKPFPAAKASLSFRTNPQISTAPAGKMMSMPETLPRLFQEKTYKSLHEKKPCHKAELHGKSIAANRGSANPQFAGMCF